MELPGVCGVAVHWSHDDGVVYEPISGRPMLMTPAFSQALVDWMRRRHVFAVMTVEVAQVQTPSSSATWAVLCRCCTFVTVRRTHSEALRYACGHAEALHPRPAGSDGDAAWFRRENVALERMLYRVSCEVAAS